MLAPRHPYHVPPMSAFNHLSFRAVPPSCAKLANPRGSRILGLRGLCAECGESRRLRGVSCIGAAVGLADCGGETALEVIDGMRP